MKGATINYTDLPKGTVIELSGRGLAYVRFVRERKSEKERKDGEEPRTYFHFTIGGRGFTIDDGSPENMEAVKLLREARNKIAFLALEATEHEVPVLDDDQNDTGETEIRKSFRFVTVVTVDDVVQFAKNEGEVAKVEAAFAPKENTLTDAKLAGMIGDQLKKLLPGIVQQAVAKEALAEE